MLPMHSFANDVPVNAPVMQSAALDNVAVDCAIDVEFKCEIDAAFDAASDG